MGTVRTMQTVRWVDPQTRADEIAMLLDSITIISTQPPSEEREETLEELGKKLAALQLRPIVGIFPFSSIQHPMSPRALWGPISGLRAVRAASGAVATCFLYASWTAISSEVPMR